MSLPAPIRPVLQITPPQPTDHRHRTVKHLNLSNNSNCKSIHNNTIQIHFNNTAIEGERAWRLTHLGSNNIRNANILSLASLLVGLSWQWTGGYGCHCLLLWCAVEGWKWLELEVVAANEREKLVDGRNFKSIVRWEAQITYFVWLLRCYAWFG